MVIRLITEISNTDQSFSSFQTKILHKKLIDRISNKMV